MPQLSKEKPSKEMPSTDHTEAKSTGENNKLPAFPMNAPKDDFNDFQNHAEMQTKYLKLYNVMGGRRRKSRKKKRRRRRRSRKRSRKRRGGHDDPPPPINRLGDNALPAKAAAKQRAAAMPYWNKINEIIRAEGKWIDAQKDDGMANAGGRRRRRRRQRGGQKGNYGKPGIGSEDSLCGAYQTPEEMQYTPDKYIVVPQPTGSSGGPLSANDITVNLAKSLTQARANSEGDFSVVDTIFQDDRQDVGNIKLPKGGRRRRRRRKSRKKKHQRRRRSRRRSRRRRRRRRR